MAENSSGPAKPLDVQRLHYLVRLMKRYDLTALDVNDGSVQIRLRRRSPHAAPSRCCRPAAGAGSGAAQPAASAAAAPSRPEPPSAVASAAPKTVVIESPMVGTYYASSAPDAPTVRLGRLRGPARTRSSASSRR